MPEPITGVAVEDAQTLDSILAAGAWDDVCSRVRELAFAGQVTPSLLAANEALLARATRDSAVPELIQSLTSVRDLLANTIEAIERLRPKSELAEALTALDPAVPAERSLAEQLMSAAFGPDGNVDRLDFIEDLVFFCNSGDEQDAQLLAAVADGSVDLGEHKLADVMTVRRQGRERMKALVDIAATFAA